MIPVCILLLWVCASAAGLPGAAAGAGAPQNCDAAYPFMSAGDYNLTGENFEA